MKLGRVLFFGTICALGAIAARSRSEREAEADSESPAVDVEAATHNFIAHVLVPFWMLPGLGDYLCHKDAQIERTSGTHESLTHLLMMSSTGAAVLTGLFFEIDASALALMTASALAHEAIVWWDVAYAVKRRPPSAVEQHMHSFLEVLPFTALAGMCCLHPRAAAGLLRRPAGWAFRLQPKRNPEPAAYIASILVMGTLALGLPYTEEFIRCFRVDRTILPHRLL